MRNNKDDKRQSAYTVRNRKRRSTVVQAMLRPATNSLTKKIFGTTRSIDAEGIRQEKLGQLVIHPCSSFRFYWDALMLVILFVDLNLLPLKLSFLHNAHVPALEYLEIAIKTVHVIDIALNFRTGIIQEEFADGIILEPRRIAVDYLKTWFTLDMLSAIPFEGIVTFWLLGNEHQPPSPYIHLLSLNIALDFFRLARYGVRFQEEIGISGVRMSICNQVIVMLIVCHWNACVQFLIVVLQDFPANSWVVRNGIESLLWWKQYVHALFQALSHMFCLGYGRLPPESLMDIWTTIVSMVTGASCFIFFIGQVAAILSGINSSSLAYDEKLAEVGEYLNFRRVPRSLRMRVKNYYDHKYGGKVFDEETILAEANECIRGQIAHFRCHKMLDQVALFKNAGENFLLDISAVLKYEIFQPDDYIIRRGTTGSHMFFIQEGSVSVLNDSGHLIKRISTGSYFGEGCLLRDVRRTADVKADDYCYVWVLDREDFRAILLRYPTVGQDMEQLDKDWLDDVALSRASSAADLITDDNSSSIDDDNTSYTDDQ